MYTVKCNKNGDILVGFRLNNPTTALIRSKEQANDVITTKEIVAQNEAHKALFSIRCNHKRQCSMHVVFSFLLGHKMAWLISFLLIPCLSVVSFREKTTSSLFFIIVFEHVLGVHQF